MRPSNHASTKILAATITTAARVTPTTVEVFIGQTASAPEGILISFTISG